VSARGGHVGRGEAASVQHEAVARVLTTVTLTSAWFGGYALTGWRYAI
jgi:hypothetical protein